MNSILKRAALVAGMAVIASASVQAQEPFLKWYNPPQNPQPFLQHHSYNSAMMQTRVGYSIYLPPTYTEAGNMQRFPVIYWLHGRGGSEIHDQFPARIVDQAIRERKVKPLIVVYVNGGARSWYTDSPDGKWPAETTIIKELIPHIDATWRTIPGRDGRAIQGMSMGGGGALKYAFRYPELFSSVVSFAGSLRKVEHIEGDKDRGEIFTVMYGGNREYYTSEHPFSLLEKNLDQIKGNVGIKMIIGSVDREVLRATNLELHQKLEEKKVPHQYQVIDGIGHDLGKLAEAVQSEALQFAEQHFKTTE
jgi:endo-1,4-beta-xylanase